MEEKKNCKYEFIAFMFRPMLYYCQTEKAILLSCCKLHTALYRLWHSVSTGTAHSGHFSLLFQTELPQSSVAVALPNTNNTMGEAAEFDRSGSNSLHEN